MRKTVSLTLVLVFLLFSAAYAQSNRSVSLKTTETYVFIGKKLALSAEIKNLTGDAPDKTVLVWHSTDKNVARVDNKGNVTGVSAGWTTITCQAKDDERISASTQIEVRTPVKTLTLSDKTIMLLLGGGEEKAQHILGYTISPENAYEKTVSWSSSNEKVASVDATGLVRAVGPGKAVITAKSNDPNITKTITCAVTVGQAAGKIKLSQDSGTIDKGKTLKLSATVLPENAHNSKVVWSSSNENIAKVDARGTVTAKSIGSAIITCAAADGSGVSDTCKITVVQKVTNITSKIKRLVLFEGASSKMSVSITPSDATNKALIWSSDNTYIASVDSNGNVSGRNAGETTITATSEDGGGKRYGFKAIVEPANPLSLESIGFGKYLPNLLGITVKNQCKTKTIVDFNFDMELFSYNGSTIDKGSYSLGKASSVGANQTKTIKRTVFGVGYASKLVITITGVTFSDGTYHPIPLAVRESWTFRR